jgi:transposase
MMKRRLSVSHALSAAELRALAREKKDSRIVKRLLLVAHLVEGASRPAAGRAVGLSPQAAYIWLKRYNAEGVAGLTDRPRSGRPRRLQAEQTAAFKARLTAGAENDGVVAFRGRDARRILREEFDADYSLTGTYALLHRLKLTRARGPERHDALADTG